MSAENTRFILPDELPLSPHLEGVILGASEYLSRVGRCRLSRLIHTAINNEQLAQGFEKFTPTKSFAAIAGVSVRTIERWIGGDVQSCNVNAEALLRLGLRFDKDGTLNLLADEQARHAKLIKDLIRTLPSTVSSPAVYDEDKANEDPNKYDEEGRLIE